MKKEPNRLERAGAVGNSMLRHLRAQTLVRLLGTPFQKLFDEVGSTHRFLTEQAVVILRADGFAETASFFEERLGALIRGNYRADALWMNATHHYDPKTKRGLWIWPGAADQIRNWFNLAVSLWRKGQHERSISLLGACLHLVQDCCQPYHSNCVVFNGHQKYERWADTHKRDYAVNEGGLYRVSSKPEGWAIANAEFSSGHLRSVGANGERERSTSILLPRAMRSSAGFLLFFIEEAVGAAACSVVKKAAAG